MIARSVLVAVIVTAFLAGCGSSTKVVRNEQATIVSYQDVYLIPPPEDPRHVVPRIAEEFRLMGMQVEVADPTRPPAGAQGTGFIVSEGGHVITCAHVIGSQTSATLWIGDQRMEADLLAKDEKLDIALLRVRQPPAGLVPLALRSGRKYAIGADVYTIGFPLSSMLGKSIRYTRGSISSVTGMKDDEHDLQVSAQVQPGNSGGPLFDQEGVVIGMVHKTLSPAATSQRTGGALPQNVNFAVKGDVVLDWLRGTGTGVPETLQFDRPRSVEEAQKSVVKVRSGTLAPGAEVRPRLVARLAYQGFWDLWPRFRFFVVALYDFDSQEPLAAVGQGRDNTLSNEDSVIRHTMDEVRRTLGKGAAPRPQP